MTLLFNRYHPLCMGKDWAICDSDLDTEHCIPRPMDDKRYKTREEAIAAYATINAKDKKEREAKDGAAKKAHEKAKK